MKRIRAVTALGIHLLLPVVTFAQTNQGTLHGFSTDALARVDSALERYVADEKIAGAVVLALLDGKIAYERAAGWADRDSGRRMETGAIFRIASQTKAVTSVAIMMLVEEGKIALDDPVGSYIPSFEKTTVAVKSDTGRVIAPAKRPITISDLLTHTAGISYGRGELVSPLYEARGLGPAAGLGWYTADKNEPVCETIGRLGTLPFVAQPGEQFVYGYNTDILGCVVERVSGLSLDEFFRSKITVPLGMHDTYFFLPPAKRNRLATVYASGWDGRIRRAPEGSRGQGHYVDGPRRNFSGGAGLVSTAMDYARFLQMLLNGGELDGVRILSPKTVELMTTNQVGTIYNAEGLGFGLGFETVDRPGASGPFPKGTFGWGGAYGSRYSADPRERLVLVLMIQLMPNDTDVRDTIPELIYRALAP